MKITPPAGDDRGDQIFASLAGRSFKNHRKVLFNNEFRRKIDSLREPATENSLIPINLCSAGVSNIYLCSAAT